MKYYRHFRVRELGMPPELYREICARKPECRKKEDFVVESQPGDDETSAFIEHLVEFCRQRSLNRTGTGEMGTYGYEVVRHYEPDDLRAAPYLMLQTQKQMFRERLNRDDSGRLLLPSASIKITPGRLLLSTSPPAASIKIASGMFNHVYVASESARKVLEGGRLVGLFFRETVQKDASGATTEPLWEIDSDIKLPKMVNSGLNPHSAVPCYWIDERPYRNGEPHYRQCDLEPLGGFDVARTFESLGSEPGLIISQRFYQLCLSNDLSLAARPVRIDPE